MKRMLFFLVLVLCGNVLGLSGVSPGSYSVDFEAGLSKEFVFEFVLDEGVESALIVEGDLAEYVRLDKERISGRESVAVSLNLPSDIEGFGVHEIVVRAGNVRGVIKVDVAYPDDYVGVEVSAPNINIGEDVEIGMKLLNFGEGNVSVDYGVDIYEGGELVENFSWVDVEVSDVLDFSFFVSNLSAGDYVASGWVDSGEVRRVENYFRVGEFVVEVLNYSSNFTRGKLDRFEVDVESLWNDDIAEIYAEVEVGGVVVLSTPVVGLRAWERKTLVGFFDGADMEGVIDAEIFLYYGEGSSSKVVELEVVDGFNYVFYGIVLGLVVLFLLWRVVVFVEKYGKR
ncbi:MAG: hypothetical protein KJ592_03255 [Nanoarchaeota archaeon]|nr:hypothetical protein [Nanoarchaeota archaeon]